MSKKSSAFPRRGARTKPSSPEEGVAIIGMACMFPGAADARSYWQNIVSKVDAVSEPPGEPWDPGHFYEPGTTANDRVYCQRGGYLADLAQFDPLEHGVMPNTVDGGEPDQWLALKVAYAAMADAGYLDRSKEGLRAEVILGKGTYINRGNLTVGYHGLIVEQLLRILRDLHPEYGDAEIAAIKEELKGNLPPFSADTAPALIGNIIAGRLANRLDLMGPSYTVDAACASALIATEIAVRDLLSHRCDLTLVGGVHVHTPAPTFMLFCQLDALSHSEQIRPFDQKADGTILGEGLGMVVLKRLRDAERDGDRIYAVIKGTGTSSDGRAVHVMAPRLEGEELALRRAYEMAGVSPDDVGLIEAHGTATPVGDRIEINALRRVFGEGGGLPRCALGSVKSMIGHTMPAAGMAGLIKTAFAIYHKVLPPTLHCETPDPKLELERTPFYVNCEPRPWIHGASGTPRRAGVNSFGFGGVNAHVVLEEHTGPAAQEQRDLLRWENEVCILEADSRQALADRARRLSRLLAAAREEPRIQDVALSLARELAGQPYRLSVVAESANDLVEKLEHAVQRLSDPECRQIKDHRGIYFFDEAVRQQGQLAFMFPGEGAQYPNMLLDLCLHFPEVRACFDLADRAFIDHPRGFLPSDFIFPRAAASENGGMDKTLWRMDGAVEAVLIGNWAMWTLLRCLQIRPDVIVGHSTGDYSAMFASGIIQLAEDHDFVETIVSWNNVHEELARELAVPEASLVAVACDAEKLESIVEQVGGDLHVAMDNCPHQSVMVGAKPQADQAIERLQSKGLIYEELPFDRPYHTSIFEQFAHGWCDRFFAQLPLAAPSVPVYSCTSVGKYPHEIEAIKELFVEHWIRPVRFRDTVEKMYEDGVRVFVEVGPRGNLTSFVDDILRDKPHLAVNSNVPRRSGISQLNHLVGLLAAQQVEVNLEFLHGRRDSRPVPLDAEEAEDQDAANEKRRPAPTRLSLGVPSFEVRPRPAAPRRAPTPASLPAQAPAAAARAEGASIPSGMPAEPSSPAAAKAAPRAHPASRPDAPVTPVEARSSTSSPVAAVMAQYNRSMNDFLDLQNEVMRSFLERSQGRGKETSAAAPAGGPPLLGAVQSIVPGQELVAVRRLDPREDGFLEEHALGGPVSDSDPSLRPISVVPLTVSMEMLAEAASALRPDKTLVGMKDILARRWIQVEDDPVDVVIRARAIDAAQVQVEIRSDSGSGADAAPVVLQGTAVFADGYPAPPSIGQFSLRGARTSRLAGSKLYDEGLMFHGPCFQGVASVDTTGEDGLVGSLRVLPADGLFRSSPNPRFVTDPVVLDAAGQLVGYWTAEHLERGFVVFPYRVGALRIYQGHQPVGSRVDCRLRLELLGNERIRSDLQILAPDGTLWMELSGWEDRRFDLPRQFHRFWVSPRDNLLSQSWPIEPAPLEACRAEAFFKAGETLWQDLWASLILSRRERRAFRRLTGSSMSQTEWLARATAAKDAVRKLLKDHHQLEVFPADIEIETDTDGALTLHGGWLDTVPAAPSLALANSNGVAVAIARPHTSRDPLGLQLRSLPQGSSGEPPEAHSGDEAELLESIPATDRRQWSQRLRSAKEATARAFGHEPHLGFRDVRVRALDRESGLVTCAIQGELANQFPHFRETDIPAYTAFEDGYVLAVTFLQEASS